MENPLRILENTQTILLIDWPNADVPLALLKAGFTVFSYAPDSYSSAAIETTHGKEKLVFKEIDGSPDKVDIVNIFRPENEHEEIISRHALLLKAKVIWLQPPVTSANTAVIAKKHGLSFIEEIDLATIVKNL